MVKRKGVSLLRKETLEARQTSLKKKVKPKAPKPVPAAKPKPAEGRPQARQAAAAAAAAKRQPGKAEPKTQDEWVPHSAVVRHAAEAVAALLASDESRRGGKTIKSLTLAPHIKEKKATFALTCQTLRYLPVLQKVVDQTQLLDRHPKLTAPVAHVMCYEVLFGQSFKPTGPAEHTMVHEKARLREQLQAVIKAAGGKSAEDLLPEALKREASSRARCVRVNTLKTTVDDVLEWLAAPPPQHAKHAAKPGTVQADGLLPDVLNFPAGTALHDHPLVADRSLILQSRSSCMAAHALAPQPGAHVVDCCAAPGNKTTHLAALVGKSGRVDAFELDPKRAGHLQRNVDACAAACVTVHQEDFLATEPDAPQHADVAAVLLDPSCSGSGTTHSRMDWLLPSYWQAGAGGPQEDEERLERLAQFQEAALRHALRFPAARRLVYSTCSVHERENEAVVAAVLPAATELGFRLKDPFPSWRRRGRPLFKGADKLVRVDPVLDGTDGFFIALFERPAPTAAAVSHPQIAAQKPSARRKSAAAAVEVSAEPRSKTKKRKAAAVPGGGKAPGDQRQGMLSVRGPQSRTRRGRTQAET